MTLLVMPFHNAKESESFFTHEQLCLVTRAHNQLVSRGEALDYRIFFRTKFTSFVVLGMDEDGKTIDLRHITAKKKDNGTVTFLYSIYGYSGESADFSEALEKFSNGIHPITSRRTELTIIK